MTPNRKEPTMGQHRYNVQQTNGAIATVVLTEDEAAVLGLTPEQRLDAEPEPKAAKPKTRARTKSARAPRNKAKAAPAEKAAQHAVDEAMEANDTTVAAAEVDADSAADVEDAGRS